ncbi:hypothetical protein ACHAPJ_007946 [Fusarium lateritium]
MAMTRLIIALCLSMSASAFKIYDAEDFEDKKIEKNCAKALTANIDCNNYIRDFKEPAYQGWIGDVKLADSVCTETCSESLRSWYDTATKECGEKASGRDSPARYGGYIWQGWNETCVKDTKTDQYCQEIIDGFSELEDDDEMPLEELCHPCYDYWKDQFELIRKKCDNSGATNDATSLDEEEEEATEKETASDAPHTTSSAQESDASTALPQRTSSTETALSESTSPESSAAETLVSKHIFKHWYAMSVLGMVVFIL